MKRILSFLFTAMIAATCGWFGARYFPHAAADKTTINQCPMHPWVKSDKAGKCTICGMDLVGILDGGKATTHAADGIVMLPPGSPNVIGVQVSEVKRQRLARTLRVAGMMGEDESRHAVISAPVEGRIDGLSMNHEGQPVARRQPIATIFSRTLLDAADEYKNALPQGGAALLQARQKLERYGLVAEQINSIPERQPDDVYFGLLSSHWGTILKSYVSEGQYVKAGEFLHTTGIIERHAKRGARAAVVAGNHEFLEAQMFHHIDLVLPHAAKRIVAVVVFPARLAAVAVTAQIGRHHRVVLRQLRRHQMPVHMRQRIAVQQQHRRT